MKHLIFHYGVYDPNWSRPGMLQLGPNLKDSEYSRKTTTLDCGKLYAAISPYYPNKIPPLIYYTDNFYIQAQPLKNLRYWYGPKLLVCADLHHGNNPLEALRSFIHREKFDAILLLCNQSMLNIVRQMTTIPVRFLPPSFFMYESHVRDIDPKPLLVHVGNIGTYHTERKKIVSELISRSRVPFEHFTTSTAREAAKIYSGNAVVLNIPLNNDLNHRTYECMAAGAPQIIYGSPEILGDQECLALRRDLFWVKSVPEIEDLAHYLIESPYFRYKSIEVLPPPVWDIKTLMRNAFAPYKTTPDA
jgi:hypothetical protein